MRLTSRLAIPAVSAVLILAMSGAGSTSSSTADGATTANSGDVEFAQMMIPHHEQAVEMADLALSNDTASPEVKALAGQIKAAQDPEIQTMQGWLSQWGAWQSSGSMAHGSGGMMSDEDTSIGTPKMPPVSHLLIDSSAVFMFGPVSSFFAASVRPMTWSKIMPTSHPCV